MNQPIDTYFLIGLPVALAMVLALVLFSGRVKPETRTRIERAMAAVFYPLATVCWLWRAYEFASEGREINAALMVVVAGLFGWMGVQAVRTGRLAPVVRPPS